MRTRTIGFALGTASIVAVAIACSGTNDATQTSNDLSTSAGTADSGVAVVQIVERSDIVSNRPGAEAQDEELVNAWGLAFSAFGTAWVSAADTGVSGVYDDQGRHVIPNVSIPTAAGGTPPGHPTGQVFNANVRAFKGDAFIFATEDGVIAGWQPGAGMVPSSRAVARADNSSVKASYKGLAIANDRLFAANFSRAKVDVFDSDYNQLEPKGGFVDDKLPDGYAPFGIQEIDGKIFVAYAQQNEEKDEEVAGAGKGFVDVFDTDGTLVSRLVQKGALNAPWGLALAPEGFGSIGGRLLVGNFGDGKINVYSLAGKHEGVLGDEDGKPLVIDGLWALQFGNDKGNFSSKDLYFTAGPNDEKDGVFGELAVQGAEDGGVSDGGVSDAGPSDAATGDAGVTDAGVSDASTDGGTKTW